MKVLITSDIHVHKYKQFNQDNQRLDNIINFISYLFNLADRNDISIILFPGDLYNNMQLISTEVETALIECLSDNFSKYPDIRWIAISGNHDYATKNLPGSPAISALTHLEYLFQDNFTLLDKKGLVHIGEHTIYGVPYFEHPEYFIDRLCDMTRKATMQETGHSILLMHQSAGHDNPMIPTDIEVTHEYLSPFFIILNGHIHKHASVGDRFINVGSPIHRDAGDIGEDKGILIMDLDTLEWDRIILDKYPKFIHKNIGEELTEEEAKQYVIWVPASYATSPEESKVVEQFNNTLKPVELLDNFLEAIITDKVLEDLGYESKEELLTIGLKYL